MTTSRLRKKTHTHKRNIAKAKKREKMVGQKRTLNSGRPSEKQALQECHIFTNLALAME